jgi:hypothetical protein
MIARFIASHKNNDDSNDFWRAIQQALCSGLVGEWLLSKSCAGEPLQSA